MAITGKTQQQIDDESQARVDREPEGYESFIDTLFKGKKTDPNAPEREPGFFSGLSKAAIPIIGGGIAGLFSQDQEEENSISGGMGTGVGIQNVAKTANLLSPIEASAAGLRFSPELSTRKYSPAEMAVAYGNENIDPLATANLAQGGRIGFANGSKDQELSGGLGNFMNPGPAPYNEDMTLEDVMIKEPAPYNEDMTLEDVMVPADNDVSGNFGVLSENADISRTIDKQVTDYENKYMKETGKVPPEFYGDKYRMKLMTDYLRNKKAQGGRIGFSTGTNYNKKQVEMLIKKGADNDLIKTYSDGILDDDINKIRKEVQDLMRNNKAQGGMLNLGGMEKDYRSEGGFVPIGEYEKKDDVPARLSVNEFVFTADAVRGAGEGDVDAGAKKLEGLMAVLEKKEKRSGAKEMFSVSERIGEVI